MSEQLLYLGLSYQIIGCSYKVYNELGYGYQEKYYQRALSRELQLQDIEAREQLGEEKFELIRI